MTVVYGTLYKIEKKRIQLSDSSKNTASLKPRISLLDSQEASMTAAKDGKGVEESKDYHVASLG